MTQRITFNYPLPNGKRDEFDADCDCIPRIGEDVVMSAPSYDDKGFTVTSIVHNLVAKRGAKKLTQTVTVVLKNYEFRDPILRAIASPK